MLLVILSRASSVDFDNVKSNRTAIQNIKHSIFKSLPQGLRKITQGINGPVIAYQFSSSALKPRNYNPSL